MLNVKRSKQQKTPATKRSASPPPVLAPISAPPQPTYPPLERMAVLGMAAVVSVLFLLAAYSSDRKGDIDEIGLFNPTYMYVHSGKMTYPVHGFYDKMIVHPPVHYAVIGMLMRLGFTLYYAQATPTLLLALLCIWLIVRSPFSAPVQIGLLYGLWVSMAVFARFGIELFGMRPEGEVGTAWLAGLVLLESGRLRNWNLLDLGAGACLLAYACSLHYYAAFGILGAVVYVAWAMGSQRRQAWKAVLAIAAGGLLYGLPYLAMFLLPNWHAIMEFVKTVNSGGGVQEVIQAHEKEYEFWSLYKAGSFWLQIPVSFGIPLLLLSTPILLALRSTRGIALAALPLQLFLLFYAHHKTAYYFIHEVAIYSAAVAAGSLTLADRLLSRWRLPFARPAGWALFGIMISVSFWNLNKWDGKLTISLRPRVHEAEIVRAASREMLGSYATVASRIGPWYSSGGEFWHDPAPDVVWPNESFPDADVKKYFSHFDAVVEHAHMSNAANNPGHQALLSWYLDGTLRLRGFFFAEVNLELTNLYFQTALPNSVTGYGLRSGQLVRFDETSAGDHELIVMTGPAEAMARKFFYRPLSITMYLPQKDPKEPQRALAATLVQRAGSEAYDPSIPGAQIVQRVRGNLQPVDWRKMVDDLRQHDPTMQFYQRYDKIPGVTL
jgi:hypothetical protein